MPPRGHTGAMAPSRMLPFLVLALLACPAGAEEDPPPPKTWREQAGRAKLPEAVLDRLARDGFALTTRTTRQAFSPYVGAELPIFVTADSVLAGYQVVMEETLLRFETVRAASMARELELLARSAAERQPTAIASPETWAQAKRRIAIVLGVAITLAGGTPQKTDGDVKPIIDAEVARIVAAKERRWPHWLPQREPTAAFDYGEFEPRGIYTSPTLAPYFRATRFLQLVPFYTDDDVDFLAAILLATYLYEVQGIPDLFRDLDALLPHSDHYTIYDLSWAASLNALQRPSLNDLRKAATTSNTMFADNDLVDHNRRVRDRPSARILPAARLPDALLLAPDAQGLAPQPGRLGLLVGAALGSEEAFGRLSKDEQARLQARGDLVGDANDFYRQHLRCLATLLDAPERDAPALFGSVPWRLRTLQSALAGWAQLRHTWVLQSKPNCVLSGLSEDPAGFVEPVPRFFARMRALCDQARERFSASFDKTYARALLVARLTRFLRKADAPTEPARDWHRDKRADTDARWEAEALATFLGATNPDEAPPATVAARIRSTVKLLASDEPLPADLAEHVEKSVDDLSSYWTSMARGCQTLELLAHKQLRGAAFNEADNRWLETYGKRLAAWMFYGETSALAPYDDAPRIVDVLVRPTLTGPSSYDLVGVGHPQMLYVRYPWKGRDVLCQGAVMPYAEFSHSARLPDLDWRQQLETKAVPRSRRPAWTHGMFVEQGPRKRRR